MLIFRQRLQSTAYLQPDGLVELVADFHFAMAVVVNTHWSAREIDVLQLFGSNSEKVVYIQLA